MTTKTLFLKCTIIQTLLPAEPVLHGLRMHQLHTMIHHTYTHPHTHLHIHPHTHLVIQRILSCGLVCIVQARHRHGNGRERTLDDCLVPVWGCGDLLEWACSAHSTVHNQPKNRYTTVNNTSKPRKVPVRLSAALVSKLCPVIIMTRYIQSSKMQYLLITYCSWVVLYTHLISYYKDSPSALLSMLSLGIYE